MPDWISARLDAGMAGTLRLGPRLGPAHGWDLRSTWWVGSRTWGGLVEVSSPGHPGPCGKGPLSRDPLQCPLAGPRDAASGLPPLWPALVARHAPWDTRALLLGRDAVATPRAAAALTPTPRHASVHSSGPPPHPDNLPSSPPFYLFSPSRPTKKCNSHAIARKKSLRVRRCSWASPSLWPVLTARTQPHPGGASQDRTHRANPEQCIGPRLRLRLQLQLRLKREGGFSSGRGCGCTCHAPRDWGACMIGPNNTPLCVTNQTRLRPQPALPICKSTYRVS